MTTSSINRPLVIYRPLGISYCEFAKNVAPHLSLQDIATLAKCSTTFNDFIIELIELFPSLPFFWVHNASAEWKEQAPASFCSQLFRSVLYPHLKEAPLFRAVIPILFRNENEPKFQQLDPVMREVIHCMPTAAENINEIRELAHLTNDAKLIHLAGRVNILNMPYMESVAACLLFLIISWNTFLLAHQMSNGYPPYCLWDKPCEDYINCLILLTDRFPCLEDLKSRFILGQYDDSKNSHGKFDPIGSFLFLFAISGMILRRDIKKCSDYRLTRWESIRYVMFPHEITRLGKIFLKAATNLPAFIAQELSCFNPIVFPLDSIDVGDLSYENPTPLRDPS